ncbi:MAG: hypothetical protein FJZ63_04215 [Chlamydiae bacterium]|nr:hypothetical protein [Chlamydiota bacterium]
MIIETNYLDSIGETEAIHIPSKRGSDFFTDLNSRYGESLVRSALDLIWKTPDAAYAGMKEFKQRVVAAQKGAALSGPDQVYLNNFCLRMLSSKKDTGDFFTQLQKTYGEDIQKQAVKMIFEDTSKKALQDSITSYFSGSKPLTYAERQAIEGLCKALSQAKPQAK